MMPNLEVQTDLSQTLEPERLVTLQQSVTETDLHNPSQQLCLDFSSIHQKPITGGVIELLQLHTRTGQIVTFTGVVKPQIKLLDRGILILNWDSVVSEGEIRIEYESEIKSDLARLYTPQSIETVRKITCTFPDSKAWSIERIVRGARQYNLLRNKDTSQWSLLPIVDRQQFYIQNGDLTFSIPISAKAALRMEETIYGNVRDYTFRQLIALSSVVDTVEA